MARRKNAAALFEVIHADNRFPRRHTSRWSLRSPRFWFGRRGSGGDAPLAVETIDYATPGDDVTRGPSLLARLWSLVPSVPRVGLSFDPDRQVVRFQLTYTGAAVSAFALVVAIAMAYMLGRQTSHRPMPALAEQTTEELRNGPAFADVLDVGSDADLPAVAMAVGPASAGGRTGAQPPQVATSASAQQSRTTVAHAQQPVAQPQQPQRGAAAGGIRPSHWTEPKAPTTVMVSDVNRQVGLQYVIVQSYPKEEKELAEAAMQTLNQHGVLCTVERGLPYAPSWYCVVGITGFARVRDVPEFDAYVARIQQISDQFAGTSKFKRFEPRPFRWREMKSSTTTAKPAAAAAVTAPKQ